MTHSYDFGEIGRLPLPGDNVAIAIRRLEAGTVIRRADSADFALTHTVLEGHRFAVCAIEAGHPLLSWELPFGIALTAIARGDYVCNQSVLDTLGGRRIDFELPDEPNFEDRIVPYELDADQFQPGRQVERRENPPVVQGYARGSRGVGTRNFIIILATTSRTTGYAYRLAELLRDATADCADIDGIVPVTHTEGGARETPNSEEFLRRTLAGFVVHPNVAAFLAVDYGSEPVNNRTLRDYMAAKQYPLDEVLHEFLSIDGNFESNLDAGERVIRGWMEHVNAMKRTDQPLSSLKLALECGGSDAFSGISGNPLAAWSARELIRCGGSVVLAETDELTGAESYVLQNVRDLETAQRFLNSMAEFEERVAWHGATSEGNVSGGNKFRGLYNVVLKSIGAAAKKNPDVCMDFSIDYSQRLTDPGFYFMDTPGNDLESIAGMVAGGCNLIYFITGNGSITNFPFVPTIKLVTTTPRFKLLSADMDVNAGAYLDGVPMDTLGQQLFEKSIDVVSGTRTRGELAGHSQVSIWRHWPQKDDSRLEEILTAKSPGGEPLAIQQATDLPDVTFNGIRSAEGTVSDRVGLVLPTSLCSGQIGRLCAGHLNSKGLGRDRGVSRFAALAHTEGCGSSAAEFENIIGRMTVGYATHPLAGAVLLLEHGCEKTHNDYMRNQLTEEGVDTERLGWASVQLDGGIEKVINRVESWFAGELSAMGPPVYEDVGVEGLRLGLLSSGSVGPDHPAALAWVTRWIVSAGGTVVVPEHDKLLDTPDYATQVLGSQSPEVCLAFGQRVRKPGFYVMASPTADCTEIITGLGATGVEIVLATVGEHPLQGHPLVPVLQISGNAEVCARFGADLDLILEQPAEMWPNRVLDLLIRTAGREYTAKAAALGNTAFQVTRGLLGVSS